VKRYLLDTHVVLWAANEPRRLSSKCRFVLEREKCEKFLSLVSIWEIAIKVGLRKLKLPVECEEFVGKCQERLAVQLFSLELPHLYGVEKLPLIHRDPFDRLLIAQAKSEGMILLGSDDRFDEYDIKRVW